MTLLLILALLFTASFLLFSIAFLFAKPLTSDEKSSKQAAGTSVVIALVLWLCYTTAERPSEKTASDCKASCCCSQSKCQSEQDKK